MLFYVIIEVNVYFPEAIRVARILILYFELADIITCEMKIQ